MATKNGERFMKALQDAEQANDPTGLAALFADGAELSKLGTRAATTDPTRFWADYLAAFDTIRSRFDLAVEADGRGVLEWESEGQLAGGKPITYRGVSVLEWDGDRVRRFRTYYDTTPFLAANGAEKIPPAE